MSFTELPDDGSAYLDNPNVRRALDVISMAEGTYDANDPYGVTFGGGSFTDKSAHPNIQKEFTQTDGKVNSSGAAGKYQFTKKTWDDVSGALGLSDFGNNSQDLAAIELMRRRGALDDIASGNLKAGFAKLGGEWASLPSSTYKQNKRSDKWLDDAINGRVGSFTPLPDADGFTELDPDPTIASGQGTDELEKTDPRRIDLKKGKEAEEKLLNDTLAGRASFGMVGGKPYSRKELLGRLNSTDEEARMLAGIDDRSALKKTRDALIGDATSVIKGTSTLVSGPADTLSAPYEKLRAMGTGAAALVDGALPGEPNQNLQELAQYDTKHAEEVAQQNAKSNPIAGGLVSARDAARNVYQHMSDFENDAIPYIVHGKEKISKATGVTGKLKAMADDPVSASMSIIESGPAMIAGLGEAKLAAGGVGAVSRMLGASDEAASIAAQRVAGLVGTLSEAQASGSQAREMTRFTIMSTPTKVLAQNSPRYQQLVERGVDQYEARQMVADEVASSASLPTSMATALGSALTNKILGDVTAKIVAGGYMSKKEALRNIVKEGLFEEPLQGIGEDYAQFEANKKADKTAIFDTGGSLAQNAVGGLAMAGSGTGATLARQKAMSLGAGKHPEAARVLADALNNGEFSPVTDEEVAAYYGRQTTHSTGTPQDAAQQSKAAGETVERAARDTVKAGQDDKVADIGTAQTVDEAIKKARDAIDVDSDTALDRVYAAMGTTRDEVEGAKAAPDTLAQAEAAAMEQQQTQNENQSSQNESDSAPEKVWYGRRGDGYLTQDDAGRALKERQRLNGDLNWGIEQTTDGRFYLAGRKGAVAGENRPTAAQNAPVATQVPTGVENAPQTHMLRTAYQTHDGAQQVADSFGVDGARVIKSPDGYRIVPTTGMTESQKVGEAAVASIERAMGKPAGSIQFAGNIQSIRAAMDGQSHETANRIATSAAAVGQIGKIIGDNFGIGRPILVRGLGFNGAQYNGHYYVDLDYVARQAKYHPATLAVAVTGHEATHMLEKSADPADRAAWTKLKNVILQYAQPGAVEHRQKTAKGATQTGRAIAELVADGGGAMWSDHKFWARLYELDNGSTMRRVGYKFMEAATKFMSFAKGSNFDINAMVSNVGAVREAYAQVWAEKANRSGKGSNGIESAVAQDGRLPELGGRVQPVSGQVGSEQKAGANARSNPYVGGGREEVSHSTGEQDGLEGNGERLKPLDGYPVNRGVGSAWGPNPHINDVARKYAESIGIDPPRQTKYAEVDPERASRIASAYDEMKHAPDDPVVKEAYENLIRQTTDQYKALTDAGYKFWFMDMSNDENVKYAASPWTAMRDLRDNRQMGVFPTNDGFGTGESFDPSENPLLKDTGIEWPVGGPNSKRMAPVTANDLFRAVHDAFGHGMEGVGFRADGEENAWQAHARLFTGSALGAITSETRGQNSWLNYGPHGESNRTAKVEDTVFADQKTGLMPEWTWHEGLDGVSMSTPESDFKIKEFKDGSILLKGDPESIRDVMPAGVSGRVVDGGVMFKASMSHRVKSALDGDYMQFSRAGEVRKEMPKNSKGEYIGAPKKYNTPGKITKLRNNLRALAKEGETGRFWYEDSGGAVLKFVGGSAEEARKFIALLSIYSPQTAVSANSTFALRAWAQYKAGQPINVKDAVKDAKAESALRNPDKFWSGEKTGNFFLNLMREVDPSTKGQQGATIDMWMMRAAEYPVDRPSNAQYSFMENEINRLASELGWEPQQVQAAIWVAMKARMENQGVNRAVDAKSMKAGNFEFVTDRKGKKVRKFSNEPAHRLMWLDAAFKHSPSEEDYRKAEFDFGDGLKRHIGQISWEPIPSIVSGVLPGIHEASYAKQLQFSDDVKKAITDEDGNDMIAQKIGLMSDGIMDAPGVWKDNVSPGSQPTVSMAPDKGKQDGVGGVSTSIDPSQRKLNELYAAIIGLVTVQDAVGYHKPFFGGTLKNSNTTEVDIGKKFTPKQAEELSKAIDAEMVARGYKGWEEKIGLVSTGSGMRVINNGGLFEDNNLFNSIIEAAVDGSKSFKDSKLSRLYADAKLIGNNWSENRNGQEYTRIIEASGQPGLLDWVRSVLAPRVNEVFKKYSGGEGWGDAGAISYSTNEDAGEQSGIGLAEGRGDVPSYGTATEGSTSAVGYHFSTQRRGSLDASHYGTGLRGAEASRLSDPSASDIRPRVYFYVDRGNGVRPESGVGNHAHSVNLQNLYDVSKDSRGIWAKAIREATDDPANSAERAVMEAGYDGYIRTDPRDPQHYAVLIGNRHSAVPVDVASPARSDGKVSTMPRTESDSRTTFDGTSLVRKPTTQQMLDLVKSMRDLKSAAPSMKIEWGQAKVDPSEAATVNAIMEGAGSSFRFDENVSMSTPDDRNENGFFGDYDMSGMSAEDIDFDEFMAEANAELDAEFKKESDGGMKAFFARPPSSSSIKDSSIHPESALNLDEFFSGKGKSLRFDQPEYIPGTIEIRDDVVNATYRGSNVFITTKNPDTKKMVAAAQAASNYLNSIKHDILDGVDKKSANRLSDEWTAISKRDGAVKSKTSKSRNLEEVLRNMGLPVNGINENDFRILIELDDGSASVEMEGKSAFTVCTLDMAPSKHGSALYAALGVWAKNNGFKFKSDGSLSAINTYRRAEQALSFSIKTGDTGVVMPGMPSRVYGYNSAPENEQHHKDNIARLALASLRNAQELFPGISDIRYDPVTDKFTHMDGRDASGAVSRALKNETARELGLGRTTIARAAMTQEILNGGTFKSSKAPFDSSVVYSTTEGDALGESWGDPGKGLDGLNPNLRTFIAGSQIVKEDGTPVMMYHGTSQAFEAFKAKQAGAIFLSYSPKFADDFSAASQSWMLDHWEEVVGDKRADVLKRAADSIMADASTPMKARKRMAGLALAGDVGDGMVKDAIMTEAEEFMPSGPNIMPVFVRATAPFDYMNTSDVDDVVSEVLSGNESIKLDVSGFQAEYTESSLRKDLRNGEWSLIENSKVQDAIKQLGFDSFFVKEGGQRNLAVYDPGSVKSVFNSGSWNREDERLSFSTPQGGFQIPNETKTQYIRRQAQDYFIRALVVQNEVASQGGTVDESNDFYRAEERSLGIRAALVKDFSRRVVQPMMEKTVKYGISLDELSLYSYAKHAKERNDQIATIDKKMPDGGSGMTNKEAKDILDAVAKSGKQKEFDDLHGDLMGIAAANRRVMLDEDLITQDHYDAMERMYSNYIPLRGFELVDPDGKRTGLSAGRGYNIRGKETIRALGRKTRAGQLIENLLGDYERIVDRAERNQVGKFFLKFVLDNPDPKLWEIDATTTRKSFDRYTGRVSRNTVIEKGEDTISVKLNGKEIFIKVKDPLLVRALRMDYKQEMGSTEKFVIRTAGLYASLMRNTLTRYNPEFAITNASRDFGFGMAAMLDELGEGGAARFVKLYPAAIAASNRNERNTQDTSNNKMDKMFEEYKMSGGITAGFYVKDADEISKDIRSMMIEAGAPKLTLTDKITHNQVASVLRKAGNVLEWAGSVSENAARFSGYVAAREMGKSPAEAVRIAKNLTTNFDRKGEKGQIINALYVFYNAAVQGSHRFIKMASNPKVASYMAGFSAASFALAIAAASMGGDDPDDGIAYWDKIPDYVKERNFIIMLPPGSQMDGTESVGSKGRYIAIPLQYGLNLPVAFGYLMADVLRNHQDKTRGLSPTQGAVKMAAYTAGAFNPFGGSVDLSNGSQMAQALSPSLGDVLIQLTTGTNSFGRPVAPFKSDFDPKPDSENYNLRQAGGTALKVARWMNWASGGNEARSGAIDVSAGTIENVIRNMTGGTGQFVYDTMNLGWKAVDSATGGAPDISPRDIPLARRVYGELGSDVDQGIFYENRKKVQDAAKNVKGEAALGIESPPSDIAMAGLNSGASRITQQLSKIRKEMIRVTEDNDMKDGDKKMRLNELKAARDQLTQSFNAAFMDTMRSFYEENK